MLELVFEYAILPFLYTLSLSAIAVLLITVLVASLAFRANFPTRRR